MISNYSSLVSQMKSGKVRAIAVTSPKPSPAFSDLPPRQFGELASKILAGLIRPPGATRWTCRLCDLDACGRPQGHCPVYEAAKARYGGAGAG